MDIARYRATFRKKVIPDYYQGKFHILIFATLEIMALVVCGLFMKWQWWTPLVILFSLFQASVLTYFIHRYLLHQKLHGFYSFMFYINMWGHNNFEFWHKDLLTHPILKHLLHHKYHTNNYSIYYNFWDKVCATNHPEYENHYRAIKAKTENGKSSRLMKLMKL